MIKSTIDIQEMTCNDRNDVAVPALFVINTIQKIQDPKISQNFLNVFTKKPNGRFVRSRSLCPFVLGECTLCALYIFTIYIIGLNKDKNREDPKGRTSRVFDLYLDFLDFRSGLVRQWTNTARTVVYRRLRENRANIVRHVLITYIFLLMDLWINFP